MVSPRSPPSNRIVTLSSFFLMFIFLVCAFTCTGSTCTRRCDRRLERLRYRWKLVNATRNYDSFEISNSSLRNDYKLRLNSVPSSDPDEAYSGGSVANSKLLSRPVFHNPASKVCIKPLCLIPGQCRRFKTFYRSRLHVRTPRKLPNGIDFRATSIRMRNNMKNVVSKFRKLDFQSLDGHKIRLEFPRPMIDRRIDIV